MPDDGKVQNSNNSQRIVLDALLLYPSAASRDPDRDQMALDFQCELLCSDAFHVKFVYLDVEMCVFS
jgi:hypothetical protein